MKRSACLLIAAIGLLQGNHSAAADTRKDFLKLINRPRVPLMPEIKELPRTQGLLQFHISYASDAEQRVPGILMKAPELSGKCPVVIALHGTGGSKRSMLSVMRKLAANNLIAVAIDGPYHGERCEAGKGSSEYRSAVARAWRHPGEHPLYYDTVWDVMRLVDYLETREDVDTNRIGLIGISKGGTEAYMAAAVDTRIAAVVSCLGVQSFRWALDNDQWQRRMHSVQSAFDAAAEQAGVSEPDASFAKRFYDRVAPGIYGKFDGPAMLRLIAPRPLMIINGDSDGYCPVAGLAECTTAARQAYRAENAEDRFMPKIEENTGHQIRLEAEEAAIDWFVKWLKPQTPNN